MDVVDCYCKLKTGTGEGFYIAAFSRSARATVTGSNNHTMLLTGFVDCP